MGGFMRVLIKLAAVTVMLVWVAGWPTVAMSSGIPGLPVYICNNNYYTCQSQCESSMEQCWYGCGNQSGYTSQDGFCYVTEECYAECNTSHPQYITNQNCGFYYNGVSGCQSMCTSNINGCIQGCLTAYCHT